MAGPRQTGPDKWEMDIIVDEVTYGECYFVIHGANYCERNMPRPGSVFTIVYREDQRNDECDWSDCDCNEDDDDDEDDDLL